MIKYIFNLLLLVLIANFSSQSSFSEIVQDKSPQNIVFIDAAVPDQQTIANAVLHGQRFKKVLE